MVSIDFEPKCMYVTHLLAVTQISGQMTRRNELEAFRFVGFLGTAMRSDGADILCVHVGRVNEKLMSCSKFLRFGGLNCKAVQLNIFYDAIKVKLEMVEAPLKSNFHAIYLNAPCWKIQYQLI